MIKHSLSDRLFDLMETAPDSRAIQIEDGVVVGSLKGPRQDNQDRACAVHIAYGARPENDLLLGVVCDGMGGMDEGSLASTIAISVFLAELATSRTAGPNRLLQAIFASNNIVYEHLQGRGGATLTAIGISPGGDAWAVHAGDSRLYSYASGEVSLLTQDDTLAGIIHGGQPDQAEDSHDNRLLQFVGIGTELHPHITHIPGGDSGVWLLTSDGAHGMGRDMMHKIASNARSGVDLARKILFVVDAAPLGDNASVVSLVPSMFHPPKRYQSGINLTVWTPTKRLELWFEEERPHVRAYQRPSASPAKDVGDHQADSNAIDPTSPKPKPKKEKKPRTARRASTSSADRNVKAPGSKREAPLLNIVFGDENKK